MLKTRFNPDQVGGSEVSRRGAAELATRSPTRRRRISSTRAGRGLTLSCAASRHDFNYDAAKDRAPVYGVQFGLWGREYILMCHVPYGLYPGGAAIGPQGVLGVSEI